MITSSQHISQYKPISGTFSKQITLRYKEVIPVDLPAIFWQKNDCLYVSSIANKGDSIQPLTTEKLRSFHGFSEISNDEATQVIRSLDQISRLLLSCTFTDSKSKSYGGSSAIRKGKEDSNSS